MNDQDDLTEKMAGLLFAPVADAIAALLKATAQQTGIDERKLIAGFEASLPPPMDADYLQTMLFGMIYGALDVDSPYDVDAPDGI